MQPQVRRRCGILAFVTQRGLTSPTRNYLLLAPLVIAATASVLVLALQAWPSDDLDTADVLASSQTAEEEVLSQLTEGKILYQRDEVYHKDWPLDDMYSQDCSEWCLPQRYVHEMWLTVGPGESFVDVRGWVKNEDHQLLQTIQTIDGQLLTRDVASGAVDSTPLKLSVDDLRRAMRMSVGAMQDDAPGARWSMIGTGALEARNTLILQKSLKVPADLEVSGVANNGTWLRQVEVDSQSYLPLRWAVLLVDPSGKETVIEDKHRSAFEISDRSALPTIPGTLNEGGTR
jgi:hypothetical protein